MCLFPFRAIKRMELWIRIVGKMYFLQALCLFYSYRILVLDSVRLPAATMSKHYTFGDLESVCGQRISVALRSPGFSVPVPYQSGAGFLLAIRFIRRDR